MCTRAALWLYLLLVAAMPALAGSISVVGSTDSELLLLDATTSAPLMRGRAPVPCCFIGADAIARDNSSDRTWIATRESGVAMLRGFDAFGNSSVLALEADRFVIGLGHDALNGEVVALLRDRDDQSLAVRRYAAANGAQLGERAVLAGCCRLQAGAVAWSSGRRAFVALGASDTEPGILRIWVLPAASGSDNSAILDLAGRHAQTLAVDPDDDSLHLLLHDPLNSISQLARVTTTGLLLLGKSSEADCCLVLASRATIQPGMPYLDAVTRGFSEAGYTLRRFPLEDGLATPIASLTASAGLLSDPAVPVTFDVLFSDGFEDTVPGL